MAMKWERSTEYQDELYVTLETEEDLDQLAAFWPDADAPGPRGLRHILRAQGAYRTPLGYTQWKDGEDEWGASVYYDEKRLSQILTVRRRYVHDAAGRSGWRIEFALHSTPRSPRMEATWDMAFHTGHKLDAKAQMIRGLNAVFAED